MAKLKARYGKVGEFSLIAMNHNGEWGVATNVEFTFSVATADQPAQILIAHPAAEGQTKIEPVSEAWLANYERELKAQL